MRHGLRSFVMDHLSMETNRGISYILGIYDMLWTRKGKRPTCRRLEIFDKTGCGCQGVGDRESLKCGWEPKVRIGTRS